MKKISMNFLFPLIALISFIFALSNKMFIVPPLGKLLDPFSGAVQNQGDQWTDSSGLTIDKIGLKHPVKVFFDDRNIPHIYAQNTEDLYFAQGYITAYFRLWQMDFLSYASAGRLSEIFSDGFLNYDRNQRRIGILESAKSSLDFIEKDPETSGILTAYSKGVNAYINQLDYKKKPFEYKLLDYKPEPWSNLKTALIMKYMANTLSGYEEDFSMSNLMVALGESSFNKLFPDFLPHITPIVNDSTKGAALTSMIIKRPPYLDYSFLSTGSVISPSSYNPKLGSNSWVVSGKKTTSGFPILCSDPHLNLSLPSIWMEMQLSSPDINVYGVSIPGTPAVIIGFNRDIAWGITNGADDVKDWYKLKITDDYKKYELDGKWVDLNFRVDEIKRRDQKSFYDTIYQSVQGPIVTDRHFSWQHPELRNYALKWELHNPSNEFIAFIKLNKAKNLTDYKEAIRHYSCPTQNFTFACRDNTIAIYHQGNMAVKRPGEGKFILDGSTSADLFTSYTPQDSLPHVINPSCNFVLSANQHPTFANYPYYYNGYYSETRANRIEQMLEKDNSFTIGKMEAMQLDNTNAFAVAALPVLFKCMPENQLTGGQREDLAVLNVWKGTYDLDDESAELFELWWKNIKEYTWDEFKQFSFLARTPDDYILLDLIQKEPGNEYFDKLGTSEKENAHDIVYAAFVAAANDYDKLRKKKSIKWGNLNRVDIMHLTNIIAFSKTGLASAGQPEAINAMSDSWGPSWRMVVELGERPRAFGIYAGGQSGNVGSRYYDNFIGDWNKGKYYPLTFFISADEAKEQAKYTWMLK